MKEFLEGMLIMVGFILIVLGVNLVWDWHRYNEMERELNVWQHEEELP